MIKVGILSFSDAREKVHENLKGYISGIEKDLKTELEKTGEIEVFIPDKIINNAETAVSQAEKIRAKGVSMVILNVSVFVFLIFLQ